jgi:hypothetical protein
VEDTKQKQNLTEKPVRFQFEIGYGQFFVALLVLVVFFIVPIELITNWGGITKSIEKTFSASNLQVAGTYNTTTNAAWGQSQVAGISTDNTGRYFNIPIINFQFDSTMRDPATISFSFGFILLLLSAVIILLLFVDFRKKENKYR